MRAESGITSEEVRESQQVVAKETNPPLQLVRELTDAFKFFDLNGDGKLSVAELATVARSLGNEIAEDDLAKLVDGVDVDGDGYLDLREFIDLNTRSFNAATGNSELSRRDSENGALVAAFNRFDADGDGFISAEELHKVLVAFGDEKFSLQECRDMISGADADGDQLMSLPEFQALMDDHHGASHTQGSLQVATKSEQ